MNYRVGDRRKGQFKVSKVRKRRLNRFFRYFLNVFKCRHCQCIFSSNNRLHNYVHRKICLQQFIFISIILNKSFLHVKNRKIFTNVFVIELFNTSIIKKFESNVKLFVIYFFVDSKLNIDTKYDYRK